MVRQTKQFISVAVAVAIIGTAFVTGLYVGLSHSSEQAQINDLTNLENGKPNVVSFSPYWKAWNVLDAKYVPASTSSESINTQDKVWGSIQGLTASLKDPHTVFLPPSDSKMFEEDISGNFEGVGMEIGRRDGVLTVISPLTGSPARKAGMQAQDKIIEINGDSTQGMTVEAAVKKIRGKKGTDVVFTVVREGADQPLTISVTRDTIAIPTVDNYLRSDGIYVIKLHNFSEKAPALFRQAIKDFRRSSSNRLIFDLRQNPGGFLGAAVDMASYFLPEGKVIVREDGGDKNSELDRVFRSKGYNLFGDDLQMVVLVDGGSASASEILAGALSEHGVATMVGNQTFGKGSVQELVQITSDPKTSLKVTVARWLTPNGQFISQGGLTPDVVVDRTAEDVRSGVDPQLQRAVKLLGA